MANQLIQKPGKPQILRDQFEELTRELIRRENRLLGGLERVGPLALRPLTKLKGEYDSLKLLLANREISDTLLDLNRVKTLSSSLYLQGLGLLSGVLDIYQQVGSTEVGDLQSETKDLEESLSKQSKGSTLYNVISERIEKNTKSLRLVKSYKERLDELLGRIGLCRDSLREIRLELPELMGHRPKDELDKVMLELRTRIEFAQRVQREYERQGV